MEHVKESITDQQWQCSKCKRGFKDENEYIDNKGVCDECYSIPLKKRIGKKVR
ncbi:MAG: hypothetical protein ACQEWV_31755 [Bacillota bacterium]